MVNRFREQREKRNMTIEQLSELSGIAVEEIRKIELNSFKVEEMSEIKAAHIAKALGCMPSELIYADKGLK